MSDDHRHSDKPAVPDREQIKTIKAEEQEKLSAAEQAYERRQAARSAAAPAVAHDQREDGRLEQRRGSGIPWVPGLILIGLGLIFLFNNVTAYHLNNWWALFILIPAFGSFSKAVSSLRAEGELTRDAWGGFFGGFLLILVAAAFLFELNWGMIWPMFLILGGLGIFFSGWKQWD